MTLTLKTANQSFAHSSAHDDASQDHDGNKVFGSLELTLTVTLALNAVTQFFSQETPAYDDVSSDSLVAKESTVQKK